MNADPIDQSRKKIHPALSRSLWPRIILYAVGTPLVVMSLPPDATWIKWVILLFGFFYPALVLMLGPRARNTRIVGITVYYIDVVLLALAVVATHYSIAVLAFTLQLAALILVLMLGLRRGLLAIVAMVTVLIIGLYFVDIEFTDHFFLAQGIYASSLLFAFMFYVALLVNSTARNFVAARRQLQDKNRQITQQADQLKFISEVAKLVNSSLDIDEIMQTIMERLNQVFDFSIMTILFLDQEKQTLSLDRVRGDVPEDALEYLQGLHIPMSEQFSAFTMPVTNRSPRYLSDVAPDPGAAVGVTAEIYKLVPAKSILTFPLITDGEVKGVLAFANVDNQFHLDEADIDHIGHYVTYIVSALRNASDYREIQESRAAADAANKAKSQFLANMSHELAHP